MLMVTMLVNPESWTCRNVTAVVLIFHCDVTVNYILGIYLHVALHHENSKKNFFTSFLTMCKLFDQVSMDIFVQIQCFSSTLI